MDRSSLFTPLASAWYRVNKLWKPMAAWTLLVWLVVGSLLSPITSAFLGLELFRGDQLVIGNDALIEWLLSLSGMAWLLTASALALTGMVLQYAGLLRIVRDDLHGRPQGPVWRSMLTLLLSIPRKFRISLFTVFMALVAVAPLLLGLAAVHSMLPGGHDINYYLELRPREWYAALAVAGLWALLWLALTLWITERSLLALPDYLLRRSTLRQALQRSWRLSKDRHMQLVKLLILSVGSVALIVFLVELLLWSAASFMAGRLLAVTEALQPLALLTGVYLSVRLAASLLFSFLGFAFVSTVLTQFYFEVSGTGTRIYRHELESTLAGKGTRLLRRLLRPMPLLLLAALLPLLAILASGYFLDRLPESRHVSISAHRAGPPPAPENTMAALERAIAAGTDYTEIDLQRTRDSVVVLLHDADLMRVSDVNRRVSDMNYEEVSALIKRPDDGSPDEERRVVSFFDFLERAGGRIRIMAELKYYGFDPLLAELAVEDVRRAGMESQVVFMSLHLDAIEQMRRVAPDLRLGYVSAVAVGELVRLPVDFLAVSRQSVTPALVRRARNEGLLLHVWTVNRASEMADLIEMGVDGLITDDPALAVRVREELAELTTAERVLLQLRTFILQDEDPEGGPEREEDQVVVPDR